MEAVVSLPLAALEWLLLYVAVGSLWVRHRVVSHREQLLRRVRRVRRRFMATLVHLGFVRPPPAAGWHPPGSRRTPPDIEEALCRMCVERPDLGLRGLRVPSWPYPGSLSQPLDSASHSHPLPRHACPPESAEEESASTDSRLAEAVPLGHRLHLGVAVRRVAGVVAGRHRLPGKPLAAARARAAQRRRGSAGAARPVRRVRETRAGAQTTGRSSSTARSTACWTARGSATRARGPRTLGRTAASRGSFAP